MFVYFFLICVTIVLLFLTGGDSHTDPMLPMINFGKLDSISVLLRLLRSSQLMPYEVPVDVDTQKTLDRVPVIKGDELQWQQSLMLS